MRMPDPYKLRAASPEDQRAISTLINFEYYVHRHLDWRSPLDWLGRRPFWLLERNRRLMAALACPPDPPEVAWVRFFACSSSIDLNEAWKILFQENIAELAAQYAGPLAGLALHDWFARLLLAGGFHRHQDIVVLSCSQANGLPPQPPHNSVSLRALRPADLPAVQAIDELAFERLWRISLDTLTRSYNQSAYATVAEMGGEIIGYQISTAAPSSAHLARLAVLPGMQSQGVGGRLVRDLQDYFARRRVRLITVNTQSDNHASLALYQKLGFELTGERFPVFLRLNGAS